MNKEQELMEVVDESGETGTLDPALKLEIDISSEQLLPTQLASGETVYIPSNQLRAISSDKFRFAGSLQTAQRLPVNVADGSGQTNSYPTNAD